jgi:hypothetical protein
MAGGIPLTIHWGYSGFLGDFRHLVDTFRGRGCGLSHPTATGAVHELAFDGTNAVVERISACLASAR